MIKIALLFASTLIKVLNAASLQDPIVVSANYTSRYASAGQFTELNAINNNGVAVGEQLSDTSRKNGPPFYGTIYQDGSFQLLYNIPNPMNGTRLTGINDSGTFVGYGAPQGSSTYSGFIGASQNPFSSPTLLNVPGALSTFPFAINNAGTIVGGYIGNTDNLEHGFIYRADGTFQTLDDPALQSTALVGINNLGQIVGTVGLGTNHYPSVQAGFLYSGGFFTQLSYGNPVGINDSGAIAIFASIYGGGGVLYPDGTLAIINCYNPQFNDFSVGPGISAINNQGTIIFPSAGPFIATPDAPEPASVGLLMVGMLGVGVMRVFRRHPEHSLIKIVRPS